jgi:hypothetical protein
VSIKAGWWIGGILMALGIVGSIVWVVFATLHISDKVEHFQRVSLDSEGIVTLAARKHVIYFEGAGAESDAMYADVTVSRRGQPLTVSSYEDSLTYDYAGYEGRAGITVTPPRAARYRIRVAEPYVGDVENIAVGGSLAGPLLWSTVGYYGIGALFGIAGTIFLAIASVRQYRAARAAAGVPV